MSLKVRVQNFQSIEDAELTIDGLTVVTGTNNTGKSAFFRAIRGAFTNARGYDFVRHGTEHCTVDIAFDDNQTLTWMKGKNVNTYIINGKEFTKVGQKVPPEAQIFGIDPVVVGDKKELWPQIAPQITGVSFLLHEPGAVIAEAVADVRRVNQLSRALSSCDKDRRATRASLKIRRSDAKTLVEKREIFVGLDDAIVELDRVTTQRQKAEKVFKALNNVVKLQRQHQAAKDAVDALEGLEKVEEVVPTAERIKEIQEKARDLHIFEQLRGRYVAARVVVKSLEGLEKVEESLPSDARFKYAEKFRKALELTVELGIRYEEALKDLKNAEAAEKTLSQINLDDTPVDKAAKFKKALSNAVSLKDRYLKNKGAVEDIDRQIRDQEIELNHLNETLVNVLGTVDECPVCGGGLDHRH